MVNTSPNIPHTFKWSRALESKFRRKKAVSQSLFHLESDNCNFNQIAMGSQIQQFIKNDKNNLKREETLLRYMDGDWLTPEELRYLMLTSTCLEQFISRKFFQDRVDILDPDFI